MTVKPEIVTQIQTVLQADPTLQVQLKSCTDANSAATLIAESAANRGIDLSRADVVACFTASPSLQSAAISDDELDLVAGGKYTRAMHEAFEALLDEVMRQLEYEELSREKRWYWDIYDYKGQ
jgi:hypothetical protein